MADKTEIKEELLELAHLLTHGMSKLGEFLIQSAEEMREMLDDTDKDEEYEPEEPAEADEPLGELPKEVNDWLAPSKDELTEEFAKEKCMCADEPDLAQEGSAAGKNTKD